MKVVFLMRLAPIIPYNILNYLVGATSVSMKDNILGFFGFYPMGTFNVYIGSQIERINNIRENSSEGSGGDDDEST